MNNIVKNVSNGWKDFSYKIGNLFNNTLNYVSLKQEIRYLKKELEESKAKEKPYIDKIQSLKSDNRVLKILNTKLEKKKVQLEETIQEMKRKENNFFGE